MVHRDREKMTQVRGSRRPGLRSHHRRPPGPEARRPVKRTCDQLALANAGMISSAREFLGSPSTPVVWTLVVGLVSGRGASSSTRRAARPTRPRPPGRRRTAHPSMRAAFAGLAAFDVVVEVGLPEHLEAEVARVLGVSYQRAAQPRRGRAPRPAAG